MGSPVIDSRCDRSTRRVNTSDAAMGALAERSPPKGLARIEEKCKLNLALRGVNPPNFYNIWAVKGFGRV